MKIILVGPGLLWAVVFALAPVLWGAYAIITMVAVALIPRSIWTDNRWIRLYGADCLISELL